MQNAGVMRRWPAIVALVMLASTWGLLLSLSQAEPLIPRKSFVEFPLTIGDRWQGKELGMDPKVLEVLKLNDYMMRVYIPQELIKGGENPKGLAPVYLYVGYYQSQRTGATYHSPKNCLPGAGWQFVDSEQIPVMLARGDAETARGLLFPLTSPPPDEGTGASARYYLGLAQTRLGKFAHARELLLPFLPPAGAVGPGDDSLVELSLGSTRLYLRQALGRG